MDIQETQQDKPNAQQRERSAKIDELKTKADKAETDAKIEYYEQMYSR
jgi:hypothetical protein